MPERFEGLPERAQRAGHEGVHAHDLSRLPSQLGPLPAEDAHALLQAVSRKAYRVGPEGVGLDQLGPGREVVAVDGLHQGGAGQVELVEALIESDTTLIQHRAHRAVGEQWRPGESIEQERCRHGERIYVVTEGRSRVVRHDWRPGAPLL